MLTFEEFAQVVLDELVKSGVDSTYNFTGIRETTNGYADEFCEKNPTVSDAAKVTTKMILCGERCTYESHDVIAGAENFNIFVRVVEAICGDIRASVYRRLISLSGRSVCGITTPGYYDDNDECYLYF